jgi:hypothetical protein
VYEGALVQQAYGAVIHQKDLVGTVKSGHYNGLYSNHFVYLFTFKQGPTLFKN